MLGGEENFACQSKEELRGSILIPLPAITWVTIQPSANNILLCTHAVYEYIQATITSYLKLNYVLLYFLPSQLI